MKTLSEYEIHELILEDIEFHSPNVTPDRIKFKPGSSDEIPEGWYEMDWDAGIWRRITDHA